MIGRGIFKVDDYARFGELFEKLVKAGAYYVSYIPKRDEVLAWARKEDEAKIVEVVDGYDWAVKKLRGKLLMFRIKW